MPNRIGVQVGGSDEWIARDGSFGAAACDAGKLRRFSVVSGGIGVRAAAVGRSGSEREPPPL